MAARPAGISCLHPGLKAILEQEAKHILDTSERQAYLALLGELANCPRGMLIGLEAGTTEQKNGRKKRAPSAYNNYVKKCMGQDGKPMKECAVGWKALSPEQQARYKEG